MKGSRIVLGGLIASLALVLLVGLSDPSYYPSIQKDTLADSISAKIIPSINAETDSLSSSSNLSLSEIFEKTEDGVVSITVKTHTTLGDSSAFGSGFVYDTRGHIITNNHVVEDATNITVTFVNGKSYKAQIVGTDPFTDIAVIKVPINNNDKDSNMLHALPIGDSSQLKVGDKVTAIGNPFGLSGSMTAGIVSQMGRLLPSQESGFSIPDVIQTDAAINPGNSGGPLLNMKAQVVGITTAIFSNGGDFAGVGFAVPSKTVSKIVPSLIETGEYKQPWIGITTMDVSPDLAEILDLEDAKGIMVMTVVKDSPADNAGLQGSSQTVMFDNLEYKVGGDVILSIDGQNVRKIDDVLIHLQREKNVGDEISLKILRDGKPMDITVKLEQRPSL